MNLNVRFAQIMSPWCNQIKNINKNNKKKKKKLIKYNNKIFKIRMYIIYVISSFQENETYN